MGVTVPNASSMNWFKFTGLTSELSPKGLSTDYRNFTVDKAGEFNFKIGNSYTSVDIVDQNNKVVARMKSQQDVADASAKLGPGTYTAVISQTMRGVNMREYSLEVTQRQNTMMLSSGASLKSTARPALSGDPGVQKHTLNVVQGGEFTANFSLPYSRWAVMSKDGKVVASGDTMKPGEPFNLKEQKSFKIDPGQYEVVIVPPKNVIGEVPYQLNFLPKVASIADDTPEERPIDKILRERESRLKQWAATDSSKTSTTKKTA